MTLFKINNRHRPLLSVTVACNSILSYLTQKRSIGLRILLLNIVYATIFCVNTFNLCCNYCHPCIFLLFCLLLIYLLLLLIMMIKVVYIIISHALKFINDGMGQRCACDV